MLSSGESPCVEDPCTLHPRTVVLLVSEQGPALRCDRGDGGFERLSVAVVPSAERSEIRLDEAGEDQSGNLLHVVLHVRCVRKRRVRKVFEQSECHGSNSSGRTATVHCGACGCKHALRCRARWHARASASMDLLAAPRPHPVAKRSQKAHRPVAAARFISPERRGPLNRPVVVSNRLHTLLSEVRQVKPCLRMKIRQREV